MKGAVEFLIGWLIEDPSERLVTAPSVSPENHFVGPNGKPLAVSIASTMDVSIVRDLFTATIDTRRILNADSELRTKLQNAVPRLVPFQIGKYGQLQEWSEDFEEATRAEYHGDSRRFERTSGDAARGRHCACAVSCGRTL